MGGPGSDAYIRTKGGRCVCKGGKRIGLRAEILAHRDLDADLAVQRPCAERAGERGLLLGRLELDEARDARGAAVVDQAEGMDRAERLAELEDVFGERVKVGRAAQFLDDFGVQGGAMLEPRDLVRLSQKA